MFDREPDRRMGHFAAEFYNVKHARVMVTMSLVTLGSLREENTHFLWGCCLTLEPGECSEVVGDNLSGMLYRCAKEA